MMPRNWPPLLWSGLWLLVMVSALASRPLMPVDETRYLAVAWDMWREGNFLVPHLNGEPYNHKPPLLFWLIHLGWAAFGVNEWWPRLVAPLFGLGSLFLTARLARELWPEASAAAHMAPLVLFGGLFWALFTTLTMFDMILAFCTLLSLIGMVRAWRASGPGGDQGGEWFGFGLMGLGIGLGVLAKGPAILVHILPVALLAPWWGRALPEGEDRRSGGWYLGLFGAVALGAAIGLAWAVPAGIAGGEAYREAIFWGQSAGRMVSSFAHRQPWWWYGAALPVLLLPWVLWPPIWGAAGRLPKALGRDGGVRFCIAWLIPALVIFSTISGKQFHYLLPELPAIALVLARLLFDGVAEKEGAARDQIPPGLFYVIRHHPFCPAGFAGPRSGAVVAGPGGDRLGASHGGGRGGGLVSPPLAAGRAARRAGGAQRRFRGRHPFGDEAAAGRRLRPETAGPEARGMAAPGHSVGQFQQISWPVSVPGPARETDNPGRYPGPGLKEFSRRSCRRQDRRLSQ